MKILQLLAGVAQVVDLQEQGALDGVVHLLHSGAPLPVEEALLGDLQRSLQVEQGFAALALQLGEGGRLRHQFLQLGVEFVAPEGDVGNALAQPAPGIALSLGGLFVGLAHQAHHVVAQALRLVPKAQQGTTDDELDGTSTNS